MVLTDNRPQIKKSRHSSRKCLICNERPAKRETGICPNCSNHIDHEKRQGLRRGQSIQPDYFITYHGNTIKGTRKGDSVTFVYYAGNIDRIPKSKLIDLNIFLPQYDREQVKRFKAAVLQLSPASR
ncbi:MAG: hypothetical protein PHG61_02055 [Candidatus Marinimicrobia bacterium]|jgi:hypothetical protein|nr:hypothetical protein [Candidatus Neomarinimicrobiota bacterium]